MEINNSDPKMQSIDGIVAPGQTHESNQVFLPVALLFHIWHRHYNTRCSQRGCELPAAYTLARILETSLNAAPDHLNALTSWVRSSWCSEHFPKKRKGRPVVETLGEAQAISAALKANAKLQEEAARRYHAQRRADELQRTGRVLMCSGTKGTAWERLDGSFEFRPNGGDFEPCCCISWAFWLVQTMSRGRVLNKPEHDEHCRTAQVIT